MALELTPLDPSQLPPAVARAAGPGAPPPAKMMAARGLAPLGPGDLATALYQLSLDGDAKIADAASSSADKLPENILASVVASPLDGRVLDFFSSRILDRPPLLEKLLLNASVADETFVTLTAKLGERELEIIAGNQQRMLRCPEIIETMYFNKRARMSTVQRLLELAARNGLELSRVPEFQSIVAEISGASPPQEQQPDEQQPDEQQPREEQRADDGGALDQIFSRALTEGEKVDPDAATEQQKKETGAQLHKLSVTAKVRLATIGSLFHRMQLIRDPNKLVQRAAIRSAGVSDQEAARYAADRGLSEEIIRYIAERRDWQKSYAIKVALVQNPKTPLMHSMRLLSHLRPNDLRSVARSKNIPANVAQAARQAMRRRNR